MPGANRVEEIEAKTVALVKFATDKDDDVAPNTPGAEMYPFCTAVWIGSNDLLTAQHCVEDLGKTDEVKMADALNDLLKELGLGGDAPTWNPVGQSVLYSMQSDIKACSPNQGPVAALACVKSYHEGTVRAIDRKKDLALIHVGNPAPHLVAVLSQATLHDGDELHIVGQTSGLWFTYVKGYISATRLDMGLGDIMCKTLQVSAPIWFGNSGGGAWDSQGNLVGISSFMLRNTPNTGFFIHVDIIREFLLSVK
jgi:hypothetical protein